ncbi:hypothetical protein NEOLI_005336 [Neolecta irregularis DAH-3]|uniref:Uncharacterized protein n=1 Tax=Neolecta irregularis (strain DAH-3) TaxID=1198029 RepID=A0A1U7LK11_NEOID|nr:hypothetical protein NEOLI_005336 [Neolecta irregularis DAH-3]|eukprot:OLL22979.1 hypothetical protein NEOLI_005336 [Neolecta irregularis DAH-3]
MSSTINPQLIAARLRTLHFLSHCSRLSPEGELSLWNGQTLKFDAVEAVDSMESKIAIKGLSTSWGKANVVLRGGDLVYLAVEI